MLHLVLGLFEDVLRVSFWMKEEEQMIAFDLTQRRSERLLQKDPGDPAPVDPKQEAQFIRVEHKPALVSAKGALGDFAEVPAQLVEFRFQLFSGRSGWVLSGPSGRGFYEELRLKRTQVEERLFAARIEQKAYLFAKLLHEISRFAILMRARVACSTKKLAHEADGLREGAVFDLLSARSFVLLEGTCFRGVYFREGDHGGIGGTRCDDQGTNDR